MAQFKCKMCGGNITVSDNQTTATCEFCGTEQTITKIDNEKKVMLFNRANSARLVCDFDKALRNYESILVEFPNDAEAHWGLCLCRYGIEYVNDPRTGKKIPTCHRTLYTSIFDDEDYKEAIKNADVVARELYKSEADKIDKIQKNIIAISQKEEPFDIFICYKETDEKGNRTLDSVIAQDIYEKLTEKGYKVFFSRITLETKIGLQYEPIIFAALQSAKVMLAIGSKIEYFNAVWVKNEWSRFLSFMQTNKNKYLIPCFKDMEAYDMPEEFLSLQAQSIDKLGFMQDLIRGIDKILGRNIKTNLEEKTTIVHSDVNIEALLTRIEMLLEDEDWNKADDLIEKILNNDPRNFKAYFYKLLIELECKNIDDLLNCDLIINKYSNYKKAYDFADTAFKKKLLEYNDQIIKNIETKKLEGTYKKGIVHYRNKNYLAALEIFNSILNYKDSTELANKCSKITNDAAYEQATKFLNLKNYKQAIVFLKQIPNYKDSNELLSQCEEIIQLEQNEKTYRNAIDSISGRTINPNVYRNAIKNLNLISGYKDSSDLAVELSNKLSTYLENLEKKNSIMKARKKLAKKIVLWISLIVIAFLALYFSLILPRIEYNQTLKKYNNALNLIVNGDYTQALSELEELDDFEDSRDKICLINACESFKSGDYSSGVKDVFEVNGTVTVIYDTDGGMSIESETFFKNLATPPAYKNGHTFYGWVLKEYKITNIETNDINICLKACYNPIEYSISYSLSGGTCSEDLIKTYLITEEIEIPNPSKEGYDFAGWTTITEETPKTNYVIEKGTYGDIALYANWEPKTYVITYNPSGGKISSDTQNVRYKSLFEFTIPKRTGYFFEGWYYDNEKLEDGYWEFTHNVTLVAKWTERQYQITYELDGGTNDIDNITFYSITSTFNFKPAKKAGYTFAGWKVGNKTFSLYSISKGTTGDLTLIALWNANNYIAYFNSNGGTLTTTSQNIKYDNNLVTPIPRRDGYTFVGWYYFDQSHDEYKIFESNQKWQFITDVSFTAAWSLNGKYEHVVNYYYEDIESSEMILHSSVSKYASLNSVVTGDLITIDGYTTPDSQSITINQFGNIIDYYYYKAEFTVTYVTNGGNSIQSQKYAFGTNVANRLSTPIRTGYTFGGWYEDAALSNAFDNVIGGNTTLYACWTEETKASEFTYSLGSYSCTIKSYDGSLTNIVVPEYIGGKPVTSISSNCFSNKTTITGLVIPDCVTSIGSDILKGCSSLQSLTIPFLGSSVSNNSNIGYLFGSTTYSNSYEAEGYYIPTSLKKVEVLKGTIISKAIANCTSLTEIVLGNDIVEIKSLALYGCTSLKTLTIPFVGTKQDIVEGQEAVFGAIFGYVQEVNRKHTGWIDVRQDGYYSDELYTTKTGLIGQISFIVPDSYTTYMDYFYYIPDSLTRVYITNENSYYKFAFNGCDSITFVK